MSTAEDMLTRWTPTTEQDQAAHAMLLRLTELEVGTCGFCGQLAKQASKGSVHVETGRKRCWEDQNTLARKDRLVLVTAHLLVGKQHGIWTPDIELEPVAGVFNERNEASKALQEAGQKRHSETGKPVSGGWTYHRLPRQGDPDAPTSHDGRAWLTSWSVFEDILCTFPTPSWRTRK